MNWASIVSEIRGILKLRGATDNTVIGNVGDALKVTPGDAQKEYDTKMLCVLEEIRENLNMINLQLSKITGMNTFEED